jgi:hypothetical protein
MAWRRLGSVHFSPSLTDARNSTRG